MAHIQLQIFLGLLCYFVYIIEIYVCVLCHLGLSLSVEGSVQAGVRKSGAGDQEDHGDHS